MGSPPPRSPVLRRLIPAALALLLLGSTGCQVKQYLGREPSPAAEEGAWAAVRDANTRSGDVYDGFGANAFVSAVYLSRGVREARVDREAAWRVMPSAEREQALAAERAEAARFEDFLVSLFTPDRSANDLDRKPSSWRIALVMTGEAESVPIQVSAVHVDANLRALYPSVGDFDTVYRVRFERRAAPLSGRTFVLRMAGAKGRLDLSFGGAR